MKLLFAFTFFIVTSFCAIAQNNTLIINPNISLPNDSIVSKTLITSLNDFLIAAQKPNEENTLVYENEKIETFILLDEVNGIEISGKFKDDHFYKPYLTNLVALNSNQYLIQVSYLGAKEDIAYLRTSFEFIAHKVNSTFKFSSPLLKNTANWKVEKLGNNIFHYQNTINKTKLKEFIKLANTFDAKLKVANKITDFFCTDNMIELQKLIGVDYKSDYNGRLESTWSSTYGNRKLIVLGNGNASFNNFDPHDLFHDRLSLVIARNKVNKPIDEACAYLYAGSWGMTWKDIFVKFKTKVCINDKVDWLANYGKFENFGETQATHLMAEYVMNALIVKKIEKEKGFAGVWEFLNCGPYQKSNENYFAVLEKLTGISKANYNSKIWELINSEK